MNSSKTEKIGAEEESLTTRVTATRARLNILRMLEANPAGHVGGALSCIDAISVLYGTILNVDPAEPFKADRDRFLLSAGHKALAQYAVLAERGFFSEDLLDQYGGVGTRLGGHPDMAKLPGIEGNTGALGHGLPLAVGMALGARLRGDNLGVYVLLGDGELPEGSNWEAAAIASHYNLSALTALVDVNGLQISGLTCDVMSMEPIAAKFEAFGWNVCSVNGHNHEELTAALTTAQAEMAPSVILMKTVKGRGIKLIENKVASHYWKPTRDEIAIAREHLQEELSELLGQLADEAELV
ncbi:transketolase [Actinomycetaceae bacterium MB13-C1-2]|nr:transketolase [Actinomycetaceae bacterium MB13-C1-2]